MNNGQWKIDIIKGEYILKLHSEMKDILCQLVKKEAEYITKFLKKKDNTYSFASYIDKKKHYIDLNGDGSCQWQ